MNLEQKDQSPADRARAYLGKAAEARRLAAQSKDPQIRKSLERMVADWESLAAYAANQRIIPSQ
jgi:hypothetical protein